MEMNASHKKHLTFESEEMFRSAPFIFFFYNAYVTNNNVQFGHFLWPNGDISVEWLMIFLKASSTCYSC